MPKKGLVWLSPDFERQIFHFYQKFNIFTPISNNCNGSEKLEWKFIKSFLLCKQIQG